jgi:predicted 3-demethylubiquinone-9 3-methyltransferase (glyoxalase superfamily)
MQLSTHIMFQNGRAAEAAEFYATLLDDAELVSMDDSTGTTLARVRLAGHELVVFESPVQHGFDMTPAVSLFLEVDELDQVDALFEALSKDGKVLMPVGDYGFAPRYGWCIDRFGMSWQVARPA